MCKIKNIVALFAMLAIVGMAGQVWGMDDENAGSDVVTIGNGANRDLKLLTQEQLAPNNTIKENTDQLTYQLEPETCEDFLKVTVNTTDNQEDKENKEKVEIKPETVQQSGRNWAFFTNFFLGIFSSLFPQTTTNHALTLTAGALNCGYQIEKADERENKVKIGLFGFLGLVGGKIAGSCIFPAKKQKHQISELKAFLN